MPDVYGQNYANQKAIKKKKDSHKFFVFSFDLEMPNDHSPNL